MNYHKLCLEILNNLTYKPRILLHSCCGPCSSHVITFLSKYFKIDILYYNPNIYPEEEYLKRKSEQIRLIKELQKECELGYIDCDYDEEKYYESIKGLEEEKEGGKRCINCFKLRLEKTAIEAKKNNYDYFTTTLSVSPYKNSKILNEIGLELEKKYNIKWLPSDFKKEEGYKKSIELSKKYNLYRQHYCGCKYSLKDYSKE